MSARPRLSDEERRKMYAERGRKSAETKLAKRILKTCPQCGRQWREKPSHGWRKYCCMECMAAAMRTGATYKCDGCGVVKRYNPKQGKPRLCFKCCRTDAAYLKNQSEANRRNNHSPQRFQTEESEAKRLAMIRSDGFRKRLSEVKKGVPQKGRASRFNPQHVKAVECFFRDPTGRIHYCKNISRFVAMNKGFFDPEDVKQRPWAKNSKSYQCNATQGLGMVYRGRRGSWKGWCLVSEREGRERFDLLGRNAE